LRGAGTGGEARQPSEGESQPKTLRIASPSLFHCAVTFAFGAAFLWPENHMAE